ncbi:MAG: rhodanese-like domain-containing protein [Candidatus Latescibacterota bacterium]|jgi:phage shock protein E|tara:strand:+ start:49 stop:351 length:303 start_codon:yes stop_codon:yes gene_type:complete
MDEYNSGHVDGAAHIPYEIIGDKIAALSQDKSRDIVLYCRSGRRSGIAQKTLQDMGYTRVVNAGGLMIIAKNWASNVALLSTRLRESNNDTAFTYRIDAI